MTIFLHDTFTAPDGTLLTNHTSDSGAAWLAHPSTASAQYTVTANRVRCTLVGVVYADAPAPQPNYDIEVDYHYLTDDASSYILGRLRADAVTAYMARHATNAWQIYKIVNGTSTQLGTTPSGGLTSGQTYAVRLSLGDNVQRLYVGGALVVETTDADAAIQAAGYVGLRDNGGTTTTTGKHIDRLVARVPESARTIHPVLKIGSSHIGPMRVGERN